MSAHRPTGRVTIAHDEFSGDIIGHYTTREGKRGVVVQQDGTRVVHVYGEKWLAKVKQDYRRAVDDVNRMRDDGSVPSLPTLTQSEVARSQGYTGDVCSQCGQFRMRQSGHCLVCDACGTTTGCS